MAPIARVREGAEIRQLVEEPSRMRPEWRDNEVVGHGEVAKRFHHPEMGPIELEFSTFAVEGRSPSAFRPLFAKGRTAAPHG